MRHRLRAVGAVLLSLASWQAGAALYIPAKAWIAQRLLARAWTQTLAGELAAKPWPWADTWPVGRLRAPRQERDLVVLAGASGRTLAFGPALADGTAQPGERGTSVVSGHRDTHFRFLQSLAEGDELELESARGARERFVVESIEIVDSRATRLDLQRPDRALVLVTCYPFDAVAPGGPLRYVVTASLSATTGAGI